MKKPKFALLFLIFFYWSSFAQEQKMTDTEVAAFKQSVNNVSKKIKTLSADFVQLKHMDFLTKDIETSGKLFFSEPNLLKWQYKKPYNYTIVFKNGKVLIDNEGKKSTVDVGNNKIFGKINKLIVGSVSGNMFDDNEFITTYGKTKTYYNVKLVPKDASIKKYIKQIVLTFDKDDDTVIQIKLIESSEDYTKIILNNKILNAKISDTVFTN